MMERVALALVFLSAAVCLVNSQRCSEQVHRDILVNGDIGKYIRGNYISTDFLVDVSCGLSWGAGIFTITIVRCQEGYAEQKDSDGQYACLPSGLAALLPPGFVLPDPEAPADTGAGPSEQPSGSEAPSEQPTQTQTDAPTGRPTQTVAPTERPTNGELPRCPSGTSSYRQNSYTARSLSDIEQHRCYIATSVQGSPSRHATTIYVCKPGFRREPARRGQFQCTRV